jgi:hypothetical protein
MEMTVVTVQEYGQSQSGGPKVKASGKWYFLNKSLEKPPMGSVEIKEGSFTMGDKTFPTIEAWRPAGGNPPPQHNAQSAPAAPPAGDYIDEATMRFISNCVGQAISAGTIKEPGQILAWFSAAKAAISGQKAPIPFDDRIPM